MAPEGSGTPPPDVSFDQSHEAARAKAQRDVEQMSPEALAQGVVKLEQELSVPEKEEPRSEKEDAIFAMDVIRGTQWNAVTGSKANTESAAFQIRPIVESAFKNQPDGIARAKRLLADAKFVREASEAFYEPFREDAQNLATALFDTGDFPPTKEGEERFIRAAQSSAEKAMIPEMIAGQEAARLFYDQREKRVDDLLEQASDPETGRKMKEALHGPDSVMSVMDSVRALEDEVRGIEPEVETAWKERMKQKLWRSTEELPRQTYPDEHLIPEKLEKQAAYYREQVREIESILETHISRAKELSAAAESNRTNEKKLRDLRKDVELRMDDVSLKIRNLDEAMLKRTDSIVLARDEEEEIDRTSRTEEERWERDWMLRERKAKESNAADLLKKHSLKQAFDALRTEDIRLTAGVKAAEERSNGNYGKDRELEQLHAAIPQNTRVLANTREVADAYERRARKQREEFDAAMRVFAMHPLAFKEELSRTIKDLGGDEKYASFVFNSLLERLESERKEFVKEKKHIPDYLDWTKRASTTEWIKRKLGPEKKAA